jgi:hypothetical protein
MIYNFIVYFINFIILSLTYLLYNSLNYNRDNKIINDKNNDKNKKPKKKIGLLTNEIPPIIYGGVSTWIINFMKMFNDDSDFEVIPIFLAYADKNTNLIKDKYKGIRIVYNQNDIYTHFKDIDICVNNLWIALDSIKYIVKKYPNIVMISVCHSLIKMEHLTNLGSSYTDNYYEQEITFQYSDYVVLISKAEKKYYEKFGYTKYNAIPTVIYNSYSPKYDDVYFDIDYSNNNPGYIGRHVPRKRPELALLGTLKTKKKNINVINMGVDYDKNGNDYWKRLEKEFEDILEIIPFTSNIDKKNYYWKNIGVNSITGIYEPFGYTICETLDRRIPAIVQNIDGPYEIIGELKDYVYLYDVDKENFNQDIQNYSNALEKFWNTNPNTRRVNAFKARKALDNFRPYIIKEKWKDLLSTCLSNDFKKNRINKDTLEEMSEVFLKKPVYTYFNKFKQFINKVFEYKNTE